MSDNEITIKEVARILGVPTNLLKWQVRRLFPNCELSKGVNSPLTDEQVKILKQNVVTE